MIVVMITALLVVLGAMMGSFVGAFVWRLHKGKDWVKGRSECEHCHHVLSAADLVPIVSWLALAGKCRYCRKPIGWDALALEVVTAGLFGISYALWPELTNVLSVAVFASWLIILTGLIALAVYDIRWMLLPDNVVFPLTVVGVLWLGLSAVAAADVGVFVQGAIGGALIFGFFYALFQVSGGKWIGGGDVKIGVLLGVLAGSPAAAALVVFVASLLGCFVGVPLIIFKGKKASHKIPFGPFLIAATIIMVLYGDSIITWYKDLLLL